MAHAELPPAAWITGQTELDVSGLSQERVTAYAQRAAGPVHLERRGERTLLVVT